MKSNQSNQNSIQNINAFFEYIKMPPTNTSVTILKNCISILSNKNNKKPTFNLLKQVVASLKLNWQSELCILRYNLKIWHKNHYKNFCSLYSEMPSDITKPNILKVLAMLKNAYLKNQHTCSGLSLYAINKEFEETNINDRKILRSNII